MIMIVTMGDMEDTLNTGSLSPSLDSHSDEGASNQPNHPAAADGATVQKRRRTQPNSRKSPSKVGRLACDICRERKVRCDREIPCSRCRRLDYTCTYRGRTQQRALQADLPRQLCEMQNRLTQAEARLEIASIALPIQETAEVGFASIESMWPLTVTAPDYSSTTSAPFDGYESLPDFGEEMQLSSVPGIEFDWGLVDLSLPFLGADALEAPDLQRNSRHQTASIDTVPRTSLPSSASTIDSFYEEISAAELEIHHQRYFDHLFPTMPMVSKARFYAALRDNPNSEQIRSLSYAIALFSTTLTTHTTHLQQTCYNLARQNIETCERNEDDSEFTCLNIFQALLFILRFELTRKAVVRAWMTLGRATRLMDLLRLNQISSPSLDASAVSGFEALLPATLNHRLLEERRRSFWVLYILESYGSTRSRMPCQIDDRQICVALPSPGPLDTDVAVAEMPLLNDYSNSVSAPLSVFSGLILMCSIARLCRRHIEGHGADVSGKGFWDRHFQLVKTIANCNTAVRPVLASKAISEDSVAFSLHLSLLAIELYLHEAATTEGEKQGFSPLVTADSQKRSGSAASKIAMSVRANWPNQRSEGDFFTLQATFIAWPLFMAIKRYQRDLSAEDSISSCATDSIRFLVAALDQVESQEGYWHNQVKGVVRSVEEWEGKQNYAHVAI